MVVPKQKYLEFIDPFKEKSYFLTIKFILLIKTESVLGISVTVEANMITTTQKNPSSVTT
jgi:hypothetical protein